MPKAKRPIATPSLFDQAPADPPLPAADRPRSEDKGKPHPRIEPPAAAEKTGETLGGIKATLRDGSFLILGDEVTCAISADHNGKTFVICEMNEWPYCESGMNIVVYDKADPENKIKGMGGRGIDANWFKKAKT